MECTALSADRCACVCALKPQGVQLASGVIRRLLVTCSTRGLFVRNYAAFPQHSTKPRSKLKQLDLHDATPMSNAMFDHCCCVASGALGCQVLRQRLQHPLQVVLFLLQEVDYNYAQAQAD